MTYPQVNVIKLRKSEGLLNANSRRCNRRKKDVNINPPRRVECGVGNTVIA